MNGVAADLCIQEVPYEHEIEVPCGDSTCTKTVTKYRTVSGPCWGDRAQDDAAFNNGLFVCFSVCLLSSNFLVGLSVECVSDISFFFCKILMQRCKFDRFCKLFSRSIYL